MKFTLEIELGNEAMRDSHDVSEALLGLRTKFHGRPSYFDGGNDEGTIYDENGNTVGKWEVTA